MAAIHVGTSGYNYPKWRGNFYPSKFPTGKMLPYYSERFRTVEINYSFYRMPSEATVRNWALETPAQFTFTLKAPRRITHDQRLRDCRELVELFCGRASLLGEKLGMLLFQLPPNLRVDMERFDRFLEWLPAGVRAAFEFRHDSWHDDQVYRRLRDRGLALCVTDSEGSTTPMVATAAYAYFRLRDEGYTEADLAQWAQDIRRQAVGLTDVFVYFKHEDEGKGPEFAKTFERLLGR